MVFSRSIYQLLSRSSKTIPRSFISSSKQVVQSNLLEFIQSKALLSPQSCSCNFTAQTFRVWNCSGFIREYNSSVKEPKIVSSEKVSSIVDEISGLTLLEIADLTEVLRKKLEVNEMPMIAVMMPGMGFSVRGAVKGSAAATNVEEKKEEKTTFDLKLEAFDAAAKIKIIKEVRTFTDLGLKEAKELVEKAPTLLKKGVSKEEAEKIVEKMKDVGAKVSME